MSLVRRILVPIDFSDSAREALVFAIDIAAPLDASIEALHVVPTAELAQAKDRDLESESKKKLDAFVDETKRAPGARITKKVVVGDPSKTIIDACADTDLVLMGRHGHTGLMHMLMGSVTERVLRHVTCPVLTVRSKTPPPAPPPEK